MNRPPRGLRSSWQAGLLLAALVALAWVVLVVLAVLAVLVVLAASVDPGVLDPGASVELAESEGEGGAQA